MVSSSAAGVGAARNPGWVRRRALLCGIALHPLNESTREAAAGTAAGSPADPPRSLRALQILPAGPPLPELRLQADDGSEAATPALGRGPMVVNLWATWCAPCVEELPSLQRLSSQAGGDLRVVLVNQDRGGSAVSTPFLSRMGITRLPSFADPQGRLARALAVRGLPTSFVVNDTGRAVARLEGGARWDGPEVAAFLLSLARSGSVRPIQGHLPNHKTKIIT